MKATSNVGKALIERFKALKVGEPTKFPSVMPGLSAEESQAILTETKWDEALHKGYWQFALYWHGIHVSDVIAEVVDGDLISEVLE